MRYRNPVRSVTGGISTAIIILGLVLAFAFGGFNLPIFFFFLAISIFVSSLGSLNPRRIYGGIMSAMWMIMLALFFINYSWLWFLVGAALSALLGALRRPILAGLMGAGLFGLASMMNNQPPRQPQQPYYQPQQPYYQPPTQDPQQPYQSYQEGYQPPPQTQSYTEGNQQYPSSSQYDQPQAQYPQQTLPPQQS